MLAPEHGRVYIDLVVVDGTISDEYGNRTIVSDHGEDGEIGFEIEDMRSFREMSRKVTRVGGMALELFLVSWTPFPV